MKIKVILLTICALAVVCMLAADPSAQSSSMIYGYVRVGGVFMNGANVTLAGVSSGHTVTANDGTGHPGYYQFFVSNGSYVVTADYSGHSAQRGSVVDVPEVRIDLDISTATPTPTSTPTPTPTPKPSGQIGGMVIRNDSSSFIPVTAHTASAIPTPKPSRAPTTEPTGVPTPTPAPSAGLFSNIYLWVVLAIVAIVAILAIAVAILIYLRK